MSFYKNKIVAKTTKNPNINPLYICIGLCSLRKSLIVPSKPETINRIINMICKSTINFIDKARIKPTRPPMPIICALIFHFKLINSNRTIDTSEAKIKF